MTGRTPRPRHVALSSSLALLLGAGIPIEQIAAQERPSDQPAAPGVGGTGASSLQASGFEMVPGPTPAGLLPKRTPETPGANGFELLPPAAPSQGAAANAAVPNRSERPLAATDPLAIAPPPAVVMDPSGFGLVAASPVSAPAATVEAGDEDRDGFELRPLAAAQPIALAAARAPEPLTPAIPLARPAQTIDAAGFVTLEASAPEPAPRQVALGFSAAPTLVAPSAPGLEARAPLSGVAQPTTLAYAVDAPADAVPARAVAAEPIRLAAVPAAPALTRAAQPAAVSSRTAGFVLTAQDAPASPSIALAAAKPLALARAPAPVLARRTSLSSASAPTARPAAFLVAQQPQRATRTRLSRTAPLFLASAQDYRLAPAARLQPTVLTSSQPQLILAVDEEAPAAAAPAKLSRSKLRLTQPAAVEAPRLGRSSGLSGVATAAPAAALIAPDSAATFAASDPGKTLRVAMISAAPVSARADAPVRLGGAAELVQTLPSTLHEPAVIAPEAPSAEASAEPVSAVASDVVQTSASGRAVLQPADFAGVPARAQPAVLQLAQASQTPPAAAPAPAPPPPAPTPEAPPPAAAAPAQGAPAAPAPAPAPPAVERPVGVVGRIVVQGNERIEATTVTSYLPIQVGDTVDNAKIDLAVKTLARTDLFADVNIELQGSDLIVRVSENPIINQVVFEGNHSIKEDKLRDEVGVRPRGIFTRAKVEEDVQKIIELYRRSGRISATVTPKIIQLPQKRVDLIFEISEGPKSGILHINFIGNKAYSDNALRDVVVTRESHWYKFFQSNDNYDPDRIEYDREQIRKFYRNHGYYDFKVISAVAELAPDKNGFVVTFTIDEGPRYHFGKLKVDTELKRLNGELLTALLPIKTGQLYEDDRIEKATDALTYAAGANGFAFVDVRPRYVAHPETKSVDVTFDIKEGPRVYIERIDIVGNTRTLDYVIRREMRVAEGDAYNRVLVDRSKTQIRALGFFKDVDIEQVAGTAPDKTILRVKVTEQPTGQLTFSLGYSSIEKLVGDVGISEANFRGRGQKVDFEVSLGYLRKQVTLSFTEPRFMGTNMSAGFDVYTYRYNYSTTADFTTSSTGVNFRVGFPINQYASLGLRYGIHADSVSLPTYVYDPATRTCASGYSQSLCDEVGSTFTSFVGYTVRWDRRNDPIAPTRGFYVDLSQDFAGLGGVRYIRTQTDGAWYYGFTPKWVLSFQGRAGYISGWGGNAVRINDRFFEGGDSFRGFQIAGIGPRDVNPAIVGVNGQVSGDALGGKAFAIGTIQLSVPTPIPAQYGIKTALFTDFGTVGLLDPAVKRLPNGTVDPNIKDNLAYRQSVGISVFWKSPMGPLNFDISKVLKHAPYDVKQSFWFSTATSFY